MKNKILSIIIPMYNEEESLPLVTIKNLGLINGWLSTMA